MEPKRRMWTSLEYQPYWRGHNGRNLYMLCDRCSYKRDVLPYILVIPTFWVFAYDHIGCCACTVTFVGLLGRSLSLFDWIWVEKWNWGIQRCTIRYTGAICTWYSPFFCWPISRSSWIHAYNPRLLNRMCVFPSSLAGCDLLRIILGSGHRSFHEQLSWVPKTDASGPTQVIEMWKVDSRMYRSQLLLKHLLLWNSWERVYWRCNDHNNFRSYTGNLLYWRVFHCWSSTSKSWEIWSIVCQSIRRHYHI